MGKHSAEQKVTRIAHEIIGEFREHLEDNHIELVSSTYWQCQRCSCDSDECQCDDPVLQESGSESVDLREAAENFLTEYYPRHTDR